MKPVVGQRVFYKSKGNVYDYAAGTLVEARIESLVLRPGSNIVLPNNPVNLRVLPKDAEYSLVLTGVKQGDGVGEWCEATDAPEEKAPLDEVQPADRVEQIVQTLKKHGIHIDPMVSTSAPAATSATSVGGSSMQATDPEAAARISYEKDKYIEYLEMKAAELDQRHDSDAWHLQHAMDENDGLKAMIADLTKQRNELQDKVEQLTSGTAAEAGSQAQQTATGKVAPKKA